jgi:aminopeptidase N
MPSLTRDQAVRRAELLDVHAYRIDLDLSGAVDAGGFGSTTTIGFACREPGAGTFVELKPGQLHEATLNGHPVDLAALVDNQLPLTGLAAENELVVRATMSYSNTGEGLHRFLDPEDGAVYLYAQTFLDDAQLVFACFDQPDLKAAVTLTVSAPPGWEVAGNGREREVSPGRWEFEPTMPIATYLVSLIAGPYHVRRDEHDGIPLALYCRRGLASHLDKDADEIFGLTRVFFDRYHELFGVRYPFGKYDQAFVPEFNAGAMENAGLVTLRDEYVFRSAVADDEREQRANTMAHEMAHMWFGDLVTMRWWDDLWLNESFAEYLGHRVTAEVTRFTSAWTGFIVGRKGWGYAADQRPSTHPVAPASLDDAGLALLNFDGISYAKGASLLRQLAVWLGDDAFLSGLRDHIATHAFGNASLADLLDALSRSSGRDLDAWADAWLRQAQVNTLHPEVAVDEAGRYIAVEVVQTAPASHPTLRPHRIGVGVYSGGSRRRSLMVDLDPAVDAGRTPVPELRGEAAGDVLLLNDGDLSYAKVRFDPASRSNLAAVLPALTDPLARAVIWASVSDAVRDADTAVSEFVDLLTAGLPSESEITVLKDLIRLAVVRPSDARFPVTGMVARFSAPDRLAAAEAAVAAACWSAMASAAGGSGAQLVAARGFATAAGPADLAVLRGWLAGHAVPGGLEVDAEVRWSVLSRLCALDAAGPAEIDAELARDSTAAGAEQAARCRALCPDAEAKATAWHTIMFDDRLSNRLVAATGDGFWHPNQAELTRPYVARYFEEIGELARRRSQGMTVIVAEVAFPRHAVEPETVARADALIGRSGLVPALHRVLVDYTDELRRAVAGRTLDRS